MSDTLTNRLTYMKRICRAI